MITRRGFLARLAAAPIVALALLKAPVAEAEAAPLVFRADAFAMVGDGFANRFDVLYSFATVQKEYQVRVLGA